MFRLVATDLDGTLLRSDGRVSERTRRVIGELLARGVLVVPVTARQPHALEAVTEGLFTGWAICANGALGVHLRTERVAFCAELSASTQARVARRLLAVAPGCRVAVVRDRGRTLVAEPDYRRQLRDGDHGRRVAEVLVAEPPDLFTEPALKLVARDPGLTAAELQERLEDPRCAPQVGLPSCSVTRSGAPFVEIAAPGVDKAFGLARLSRELGVRPEQVVAFGDAPNDVAMLSWAGRSAAVAGADPLAARAADEVLTLGNDEDAVAQWLLDHDGQLEGFGGFGGFAG